jgi:WD40 repeat protein
VETGNRHPVTLPGVPLDLSRCPPALSADGRWLAAVTGDNAVAVVGVAPGAGVRTLPAGNPVRGLAFSPGGGLLAAGDAEGGVVVWDLATGRACRRFAGHRRDVVALAFAPAGDRLVSASEDGTALVWDTAGLATR